MIFISVHRRRCAGQPRLALITLSLQSPVQVEPGQEDSEYRAEGAVVETGQSTDGDHIGIKDESVECAGRNGHVAD